MINTVYIISWFGNDVKEKRKEFHQKQVDWFLSTWDFNLIILPQQYEKDDFIKNKRIRYLENQQVLLNGSKGRNILLNDFYNSNEGHALFADNDCIVEDSFSGLTFYDEMKLNPRLYDDITIASAAVIDVNVQKDHRGKVRQKEGYHWFIPAIRLHNAFTIFKNIKDNPMFYDPDITIGEDVDFNIRLVLNGYKPYIFANLIFKEFGNFNQFSTWERDYEIRKVHYKEHAELMLKKYKKYGLDATKGGNPDYKRFLNAHGVGEQLIEIGGKPTINKFF